MRQFRSAGALRHSVPQAAGSSRRRLSAFEWDGATDWRIHEHQNGAWPHAAEFLACRGMAKRVQGDAVSIDQLLDWLRQREEEMAALLAELVAIPTENPPARNYRACADLLENRLRQCGLECELLEARELKNSTGE